MVHNLNGEEFKIKGDYLYIRGRVQISDKVVNQTEITSARRSRKTPPSPIVSTDHFNVSDYESIEIFAYYGVTSEFPNPGECIEEDNLIGKTTVDNSGEYNLVINLKELKNKNIIRKKRKIKTEEINIGICSPKYSPMVYFLTDESENVLLEKGYVKILSRDRRTKNLLDRGIPIALLLKKLPTSEFLDMKQEILKNYQWGILTTGLKTKNTFELNPFTLVINKKWVEEYEALLVAKQLEEEKQRVERERKQQEEDRLKFEEIFPDYNVEKLTGPYDADGFTDFFADGNNYFLWNTKDSKRGMYRSVDSGENWERMTWDGIKYIPTKVYKYDDEYLFQYTTEDNPDGVWNSYDYHKKVWSVYEIDEFELKIFNAEKNNWEKEFNSQKSKKFPIKNTRRGVYYKDYKHNILLPYNISSKEGQKYRDSKIKPLLNGTIYERDDNVFVLNTYGIFKLMTESEIESSSNYNKMIYDNFVECKSFFESELKSQLKLEEIIKKYKETKNTVEERKKIHKDLKQELKKEYDWLNKMKGWEEDATLVEEKRKEIEIEYKKRLNNYNELDYNVNQLNDYLPKAEKWLSSTEIEIDSLKKLITDEVRSFPMFYPVPVNGINPSDISDVKLKNDTLYVLTSLNNGNANKLFLYDGKWHTVFDPITDDFVSEPQRLSIEMLDNIDDIIFISPSSKSFFPNNIYYLNRTQDNSNDNNENKYELLPYRDETGRSIEYAYTDKSGKLWTIENNMGLTRNSDKYYKNYYIVDYQLYRYKSLSDLSDPLLIQEWNLVSIGNKDTYDPGSQVADGSSVKLVKTEDSKIYFIKDNTIKQIGASRDKDFNYEHNIFPSVTSQIKSGKAPISSFLNNYTFFPYKNDIVMYNYFDFLHRERQSYDWESEIRSKQTNFFHIQRGLNKGVNQNITSVPNPLINQLNRLIDLNNEVEARNPIHPEYSVPQRIKLFKPNSSGNLLYTLDSLGTLKSLFEKREINQFVDEEFHIDSELRNGYNEYGHTRRYKHEGGRGTYKIRSSIGNNDEILIYNYPKGIKYLKNGEMRDMKPLDYFDKMKVSEITNDKDGYLIGTYSSGLYKVSIVPN